MLLSIREGEREGSLDLPLPLFGCRAGQPQRGRRGNPDYFCTAGKSRVGTILSVEIEDSTL